MRRPLRTLAMAGACVAIAWIETGCATASRRAPTRAVGATRGYLHGVDPHSSPRAFAATHLSPSVWRRSVGVGLWQSKEILVPVALGGAAVALAPGDVRLSSAALGKFGGRGFVGDAGVYTLVGSSLALGLLHPRGDRTARDEAWVQGEAFALTFGVTFGLKTAVQRLRPLGSSERSSFPSGHTSIAFCAATLISREQGPAIAIPAYLLAGLTGFSRVEAGRHFPSDVVAGAAIGTLSALVIDALHFGAGSQSGICTRSSSLDVGVTDDGRPALQFSVDL